MDHWFIYPVTPPDWKFPTLIPCKTYWELYLFGKRSAGIRPYRYLTNIDIGELDGSNFSRAKRVMNYFETTARRYNLLQKYNIQATTEASVTVGRQIIDEIFQKLTEDKFFSANESHRLDMIATGTVYRNMLKYLERKGERVAKKRKIEE